MATRDRIDPHAPQLESSSPVPSDARWEPQLPHEWLEQLEALCRLASLATADTISQR